MTTSRRIQYAQLLVQTSRERIRELAQQLDGSEHTIVVELQTTTALLGDALTALDDLSERAML